VTRTVQSSEQSIEQGAVAADFGADDPSLAAHRSSTPLTGYEIVELTIAPGSAAVGRRVDQVVWPPDCLVVAVSDGSELVAPGGDTVLHAGERVTLLNAQNPGRDRSATADLGYQGLMACE
jgi:NhaP-type Na+/H+ and K+/H+ antiporter